MSDDYCIRKVLYSDGTFDVISADYLKRLASGDVADMLEESLACGRPDGKIKTLLEQITAISKYCYIGMFDEAENGVTLQ